MAESIYWKYSRYIYQKNFSAADRESLITEILDKSQELSENGIRLFLNIDDYNIDPARPIFATAMPNVTIHPSHRHNYYEINYLMKGEGVQIIGDTVYDFVPGSFLLLPPSASHSAYTFDGAFGVNVLCRREYIEQLERTLYGRDDTNPISRAVRGRHACFLTLTGNHKERVDDAFGKIFDDSASVDTPRGPYSALYCEGLFLIAITEVLTVARLESKKTLPNTPHSSNDKDQILSFIKANYATVTLESVAKQFNLSTVMIHYIIRELTGNNFSTLVAAIRLQRAQYLLETTSLSVTAITKMLGLGSAEYFCRFFKKQTGYTPSGYRTMSKSSTYSIPIGKARNKPDFSDEIPKTRNDKTRKKKKEKEC